MASNTKDRPIAVVTGAAGGVGMAVCRLLGRTQNLLLTDFDDARLQPALQTLADEGYRASGIAGDLASPGTAETLAGLCRDLGPLRTLVNTAGLSPVMADWRAIIQANTVAAELLLRAFEPLLRPGTAAVLVASVAGHLSPTDTPAQELLADPLQPELLEKLSVRLEMLVRNLAGSLEGHAYGLSKRAIIQTCERRAKAWGAVGARLVSISPGGIWTAMGRREASGGARVNAVIESTPAGRWGTAAEMATVIEFLASDAAGYITGCDLLVDGGAAAVLRGKTF